MSSFEMKLEQTSNRLLRYIQHLIQSVCCTKDKLSNISTLGWTHRPSLDKG